MMKRKRVALLLTSLAVCLFLCGCWDRVEIESRGFVVSIGIDKYDKKEIEKAEVKDRPVVLEGTKEPKYVLTLALPNVTAIAGGSSESEAKSIKKTAGATVSEAIELSDSISSQRLYLGQAKICVFGKEILEDERLLRESLDFLERNRELNRKICLLSTEGKAEDILGANVEGEPLVGLFVANFYKNNAQTVTFRQNLEDSVNELLTTGCTLIPQAEKNASGVKLAGAAVLKNYRLMGFLDDRSVEGFLACLGKSAGGEVYVEYKGAGVPLDIYKSRRSISFVEEDGGLVIGLKLTAEGGVSGYKLDKSPAFESEDLETIRKLFEQELKKEAEKTISELYGEYGADCLALSEELYKHEPKLYGKFKDVLAHDISGIKINVKAEVTIRNTGAIK